MMRENAADLKDRLQKDYEEHGLRKTGRTTVTSSLQDRSITESVSE